MRISLSAVAVAAFVVALAACTAGPPLADSPHQATDTQMTTLPEVGETVAPLETRSADTAVTTTTATTTTTTTTLPSGSVGAPYGEVTGLTMFRGNPSRSYYGEGPIPTEMPVNWRYPDNALCGVSPVGGENITWCGTGWTGQPVVWERPDGITEVIVGTYDKHIHFIDAATGEATRPAFPMGDIIKGSVTLDPDGYPLLYSGSRDPRFKIIALDRDEPTELWGINADDRPGMWNNDWDSNPVIVDDVMYVGGENSWWYAVVLNRGYDGDGLVTIEPEIVFDMPAFSDALVAAVGRQQSVESSTAVHEGRAYFTNSAGRVVGVDVSELPGGEATVFFDFWMGDDVDASPVIDADGYLYISAESDLRTQQAAEVGQLVKLDPDRPDDPVMWSLEVPAAGGVDGGMWATPALVGDLLFVVTNPGELLAVDTANGEVVWRDDIGSHAWSSPVYADGRLLVSVNCESAPALRVYDATDARAPFEIAEEAFTGGCIESTPAVWKGQVFVGSRDGYLYAVGGG